MFQGELLVVFWLTLFVPSASILALRTMQHVTNCENSRTCTLCMTADRTPPPCWVNSINQEVIQHVWRNNLRIGEITISPILTCLSLSDWQRKTLIKVIIQQWYSLKTISCDVDSVSQLAAAIQSSTSGFVFRSEFDNPWHPKFNKVDL